MDLSVQNLHLGQLTDSEVCKLIDELPRASCMFVQFPDVHGNIQEDGNSMLEIRNNHVLEICPQTGAIISGFECDYEIRFYVLRHEKLEVKTIGTPFGIVFHFKNNEKQLRLKLDDSQQNLQHFAEQLSKLYIVQLGFHESFKAIKRIGRGMAASVYSAQSFLTKKEVAIKSLRRSVYFANENGKQSFQKEFQIISRLNHPNICEFKAVYETENSTYIVLELLACSLFTFIKQHQISLSNAKQIMRGLLMGIEYLHARGIMHRDLKLENIMLRNNSKKLEPVIVDMGLAEYIDVEKYLYTRCGTPGYVAPEILRLKSNENNKYTQACDIFSLGVILHILLFKKPVFEGQEVKQVIKKNSQCQIDFQAQHFMKVDEQGKDLLKRMLEKNPNNRISAAQALKHPFLSPAELQIEQAFNTVNTLPSDK